MHRKIRQFIQFAPMVAVIIAIGAAVAFAEEKGKFKETFNANAIALGKGLTSNLQINITRWTTEEERTLLLTTLVEKGQDEMVKILAKQEETGYLKLPNTLGYRLFYAREIVKDGKRRIILATDRPVSMAEAWRGTRSLDYAVAMVELVLDEENKGEGALLFAVKLKANNETRTLEVENYGTDPVQFKNVRKSD